MGKSLVDNVESFLERASELYGSFAAEQYGQEIFNDIFNIGMTSPIEQLFWIAANALCRSFAVAHEALSMVGLTIGCADHVYDKTRPLGVY